MTKTMRQKDATKTFILHVEQGNFTDSEIVVMLGENGTGKTTFIRMMAGLLKSDEQAEAEAAGDLEKAALLGVPTLNVSYKPQTISPKFQGTVRQLLHKKIRDTYINPQFNTDVMKPMLIEPIIDNGVQELSGGELQRVAIVLCLGTAADIYLVSRSCYILLIVMHLLMMIIIIQKHSVENILLLLLLFLVLLLLLYRSTMYRTYYYYFILTAIINFYH